MAEPAQSKSEAGKRGGDRSPNYPYITLRKAIDRAREIHKAEGRNAARPEVLVKHWDYKPTSSGARQTLGALRSFGLLEPAAGGLKLTDRALRILLDTREPSPERDEFLRQAALSPAMHRKLWDQYGADLPSDANLRYTLTIDHKFSEGTVDGFIREYKDTLAYARVAQSANLPPDEPEESPANEVDAQALGAEKEGAPVLPQPLLPPLLPPPPPKGGAPMTPASGYRQDVFTLDEGTAALTWPAQLSPESFQDFKAWVDLVMKKLGRSYPDPQGARAQPAPGAAPEPEEAD